MNSAVRMRCSLDKDDERTPPSSSVSRTKRIALLLLVPWESTKISSLRLPSYSKLHCNRCAPCLADRKANAVQGRAELVEGLTLNTAFLRTCESPGADSYLDPALTTTEMAPVAALSSEEATLTPAASDTEKRLAGVA